ncbi:MAG TPA: AraC family transcriptional regulator [Saprospiraceae bacterium]|nr:AraC family transcriptional regulator [Saprospiraceae bacterium]
MILFIKNMVCVRCKMAVQAVLGELNIKYQTIELGQVVLTEVLSLNEQSILDTHLRKYQLELMHDKKNVLIEKIKTAIIELLQSSKDAIPHKLSVYLSEKLEYDYTYLSNTFSDMEKMTIERYFIVSRIERVKELIVYEKLSISDIANLLHFSSPAHLSLQFKKITGYTASNFRSLTESNTLIWRTSE